MDDFPLRSKEIRVSALSISASQATREGKETWDPDHRARTRTIFADNMVFYVGDSKESAKNEVL